jgi:predicted DNA-binding transcriptional regulator AlpA
MTDEKKPTKLLTLRETADLLRKTESQLRWNIHTGKAPKSGKVGGRIMFREADVIAYIDAAFEGDN